jgi:hypothetical protein
MEVNYLMDTNPQKQVSDRTNIIIAANAFLFTAFASLLNSTVIHGYFHAFPILISGAGISLNILLGYTNVIQTGIFRTNLVDTQNSFAASFKSRTKQDIFNFYGPLVLIAAWALCIVFYVLQITVGII